MRPNHCAIDLESGVVSVDGPVRSPSEYSTVPNRPQRRPDFSIKLRINQAVVVFPFVPVTPATLSRRDGSPDSDSHTLANADRTSVTIHCGIVEFAMGVSTRSPEAPRAIAS